MINIGVLGYGYWGPNLVRNFNETDGINVSQVSDLDKNKLQLVTSRYPAIEVTTDAGEIIENKNIDAVAIATPVSTHYDLGLKALKAGKHVLMEKPMANTSKKCEHLIEEAERQNLLLMVDHTFPYTGAVRMIKKLIDRGELGEVYYYDSVRVNLGLFQHDVNVIWDLAVHDLAIIDYLFTEKPVSVSVTGRAHIENQPENTAFLTLFFNSNMIAHINVNWLSPVKIRKILVGCDKKMLVYDDLEPTEKIKIYDRGVNKIIDDKSIYNMRVGYRTGDMWAPNLDRMEALNRLTNNFRKCIEGNDEPVTSSISGLRVLQIMEAATISMYNNGVPERLELGDK